MLTFAATMQNPRKTYPKNEKLKSRTAIAMLFDSGTSVTKYPLRLVFAPADNSAGVPLQMGVSVSKKYFKRAHDRNYFKRVLRETYRLNQHMLKDAIGKPYAFMFFYQTKDRLTFEEINAKTIALFEKFAQQQNQ